MNSSAAHAAVVRRRITPGLTRTATARQRTLALNACRELGRDALADMGAHPAAAAWERDAWALQTRPQAPTRAEVRLWVYRLNALLPGSFAPIETIGSVSA